LLGESSVARFLHWNLDFLAWQTPWIPGNQKWQVKIGYLGTPSFGRVHMTKNRTWTPQRGDGFILAWLPYPRAASFSHDWLAWVDSPKLEQKDLASKYQPT
jgi:hypothetical protein